MNIGECTAEELGNAILNLKQSSFYLCFDDATDTWTCRTDSHRMTWEYCRFEGNSDESAVEAINSRQRRLNPDDIKRGVTLPKSTQPNEYDCLVDYYAQSDADATRVNLENSNQANSSVTDSPTKP